MEKFLMSIAGFDPTGGAGILRDIKTFWSLGFLGCGALTANTVQNTKGVEKVEFVNGEFLISQIEKTLEEIPVLGVKIGLPHREYSVNLYIKEKLEKLKVPVVFDTVIAPTFGKKFVENLKAIEPLLELSDFLTPNEREYAVLKDLFKEKLKEKTLIVKGIKEGGRVYDLLIEKEIVLAKAEHQRDSLEVRGTGCAFSSAFLSFLVKGGNPKEAFNEAVNYLREYRKESFKLKGWKQRYSLL